MKGSKIIGSVLTLCGGIIIVSVLAIHINARISMNKELNNRLIYKSDIVEDTIERNSSLVSDITGIQSVSGDMDVPLVESYINVLEIPSCCIKVPVIEGVDDNALLQGVGHFDSTPYFGEDGNTCYAGHSSTIYNCVFNTLSDIKLYDEVVGYDSEGNKFVYNVINKFIVNPEEVGVLSQTKNVKELTLVTCTDDGTKRFIVKCRMFNNDELSNFIKDSTKEKREKLNKINDNIGTITISNYIKNRNIIEKRSYIVPPYKPHDSGSIVDNIIGGVSFELQ